MLTADKGTGQAVLDIGYHRTLMIGRDSAIQIENLQELNG